MINTISYSDTRLSNGNLFLKLIQEVGNAADVQVYLSSSKKQANTDVHIFVDSLERGEDDYVVYGAQSLGRTQNDAAYKYPQAEIKEFPYDVDWSWETSRISYPYDLKHPTLWVKHGMLVALTTDTEAYLTDFCCIQSTRENNSIAYAQFIQDWQAEVGQSWEPLLCEQLMTLSQRCDHVKVIRAETEFDTNKFIRQSMNAVSAAKVTATRRAVAKIARLEDKIVELEKQPMKNALEIIGIVVDAGFVFEKPHLLRYTKGKISTHLAKWGDKVYDVNTDMWITGLRVHINSSGDMVNASCHSSYHPNAERRVICMGTLNNAHISKIGDVVPALLTPNVNSCYEEGRWEDLVEDNGVVVDDSAWRT